MQALQSKTKKPWMHIPMEIVDRELYPKLLLAMEAIERGWGATIGTKKAIFSESHQLPQGVVYLKSVIPSELSNIRKLKESGHRLVSLDEEGLVQSSLETLVSARYCTETIKEVERFFCWGDIQRLALQEAYPDYAERFTTTGSPTADLWSLKARDVYKDRVNDLQKRFGKYILIPSSFGVPNHFMGQEEALGIMKRDNMFRDEKDYEYYKGYHDHVHMVFERFLELLPLVAEKFQDYTIILRPHPSENHDTWKRAAKDLKNVTVIFEGPVSPWLIGADAILHWGSTTGIESYLLGKPVVAYSPYPEQEQRYDVLPHLVSILRKTPEEILAVLTDVLERPDKWSQRYPDVLSGHETLKSWIYNIDNPLSIKGIMDEISSMQIEPQIFYQPIKTRSKTINWKDFIWSFLEKMDMHFGLTHFFPERIRIGLKSRAFGKQKTKEISPLEIQTAVSLMTNNSVQVTRVSDNLFCLSLD